MAILGVKPMPWWALDLIAREPWQKPHLEAAFANWKPTASEIRRERERGARLIGTHSEFEWHVLRSLFDGCVRCGARPVQKDHIMPFYAGGCDCIANVQPLCRTCNAGKAADHRDYRCLANPVWMREFQAIVEIA